MRVIFFSTILTPRQNFMKCLTRLYASRSQAVIFYENAAHPSRFPHAAMTAVPLPLDVAEMAPAFFKEAILTSDEEWSQHKKIIDTLTKAREGGFGRAAFRKSVAKEMPYFHVRLIPNQTRKLRSQRFFL